MRPRFTSPLLTERHSHGNCCNRSADRRLLRLLHQPCRDCNRGERLRADNPIARSAPDNFVADGTPESEWPSEYSRSIAEAEAAELEQNRLQRERSVERAKRNRIKLEPPRLYRLKEDLIADRDGRAATILKGSVVIEGDPLLAEFPGAFE